MYILAVILGYITIGLLVLGGLLVTIWGIICIVTGNIPDVR